MQKTTKWKNILQDTCVLAIFWSSNYLTIIPYHKWFLNIPIIGNFILIFFVWTLNTFSKVLQTTRQNTKKLIQDFLYLITKSKKKKIRNLLPIFELVLFRVESQVCECLTDSWKYQLHCNSSVLSYFYILKRK